MPALADQNVELLPALEDRRAQPVDGGEILEVGGNQGGGAAELLDLVVEFLKAALGARHGDDMGAFPGQRQGGGAAKSARGTGDHGDAVGKLLRPCGA